MTLNLLTSPWLEVKRQNGEKEFVSISELTSLFEVNPIIALDFPRPDWNAAVTEFIIGVFFLIWAPKSSSEWANKVKSPPTNEEIEAVLAQYSQYFDFDGENIRAFQDFDKLEKAESKPISGLLIDAPGENAVRNNSDLFIKRADDLALCIEYAAAALITMQDFAPSGGAGHRTSMRGGGPLLTLLSPIRLNEVAPILWDIIWSNVPNVSEADELEPQKTFPWIVSTIVSPKAESVIEDGNHPALAFFATPRRIRLEFETGICSLSGREGIVVKGFRTQNYGANYPTNTWQHPLSPYYSDKSGFLPLHPNAGQSDYGDWLAWWGAKVGGKAAKPITQWDKRKKSIGGLFQNADYIVAMGFDMDNMKARQWLSASIPFIPIYEDVDFALNLKSEIQIFISASDEAARACTRFAKLAIYGQKTDNGYKLPDNLNMESLKEIGDSLWQETENDFREILIELQSLIKSDGNTMELRIEWRRKLANRTLRIFEQFVDIDGLMDEHPHRILWARKLLAMEFVNGAKAAVTKALNLYVPKKDAA